ncbi:hypothetical protein [Actinoplanes sp. CA-252034]
MTVTTIGVISGSRRPGREIAIGHFVPEGERGSEIVYRQRPIGTGRAC